MQPSSGGLAFVRGLARTMVPPPPMNVNDWARAHRFVAAEAASPAPGKWNEDLAPYLKEVQDCLSPTDPCRTVTAMKGNQLGFSECGLNLFGASAHLDPCPILFVLPTIDEAKKYNRIKLQPTIAATPALRDVITEEKSRDAESSTAMFKRFRAGYAVLTGANASAGLQMISARKRIYEEVSEYPDEAGERGDPIEQGEARGDAWSDRDPKSYFVSTPGIKGGCRISARYEASDQRRFYVPCPQCHAHQALRFENLKVGSTVKPFGAYFVCQGCGHPIPHSAKRAMLRAGVWIKCYPGDDANPAPPALIEAADLPRWRARKAAGRDPGFHLWRAYSPFVPWDDLHEKARDAEGNRLKMKAWVQQGLAEPFEEKGEAPPAELLLKAREDFTWQRVPPGALLLTAFCDVQGGRLEYGVYAWGRQLEHGWHIDGGVIPGDPNGVEVWRELDRVLERTYPDHAGRRWDIDAFGVDTGYLPQRVYAYVRRHPRPRLPSEPWNLAASRVVMALDGRAGWNLPPIGMASKVDVDFDGKKVGEITLWPTGTWGLKSSVYHALGNLIAGQDQAGRWHDLPVLHFSRHVGLGFFEQLTAEHVGEVKDKRGQVTRAWVKRGPNEQLDIVVGARALAEHWVATGNPQGGAMEESGWQALAARRQRGTANAQGDLVTLMDAALPEAAPSLAKALRGDDALADPSRSGPRRVGGKGRKVT